MYLILYEYTNNLIGKIVIANGKYCNLDNNPEISIDEAIPVIQLSQVPFDKRAFGVVSGIEDASDKRVGPIDPQGAWTKVQEATLAGAKGKAKLTRDKELGATKMKMGGKMGRSEKSYGLDKKQKATKEVNPAGFRKAALKRESELVEKRSGEMAPKLKSKKK